MRALIIFAHGSRRATSNEEVASLADKVAASNHNDFDTICYAFLELAEPDMLSTIDKLVENNCKDITLLPYFLNSGTHVKQDIPELVEQARQRHPDCDFKVAQPIGMYAGMPDLILQSAQQI